LLIAPIQTPHRFRTKPQLWTYSGLAIDTRGSAQCRYVGGQPQRSKKTQQLRGLNQNHNHEMKEIFKSAANMASGREGAFHDFYQGLLTKGMQPAMARLTLVRKIAAITLILWKKARLHSKPRSMCNRLSPTIPFSRRNPRQPTAFIDLTPQRTYHCAIP
jgi:hypothetical protein